MAKVVARLPRPVTSEDRYGSRYGMGYLNPCDRRHSTFMLTTWSRHMWTLGRTQTADEVVGRAARIAVKTLLGVTPQPGDHAAAYVYLADPVAARVTTGIVINTDGGRRM
jgi:hypothetical protein